MRIRIDDITKGTFSLPTPIDTRELVSRALDVEFYNVYEEQICRWARAGENSKEFKIKPGYYSFKDMSKLLTRRVEGLDLSLDKMTGLIDLTVPANIEVWLTEPIKYMLGLDDKRLDGAHDGDRPVEFLPAGGISIYLDEVSATNILSSSKSSNIQPSNLLCNIPILSGTSGQYFLIQYDNTMLLDLGGVINQLEFRLKLQWGNGIQHKSNNHFLLISLELEIKEFYIYVCSHWAL